MPHFHIALGRADLSDIAVYACRLVTELCHGTLEHLVSRVVSQSEHPGLPPMDVVTLGLMLCCALHAVHHRAQYLHLDIKPSNVLIKLPPDSGSLRGRDAGARASPSVPRKAVAKLTDFGLSRHLPEALTSALFASSQDSSVEVCDVAKGTLGYAPPEQLRRRVARRRSDVYSVGATLKYAASARHPYGAADYQTISQQLHDGAAPLCCTLSAVP